jgi:hypothetical protein
MNSAEPLLIGFGWRSHLLAIDRLFLLYRMPKAFCDWMAQFPLKYQVINATLLCCHAVPYIFTFPISVQLFARTLNPHIFRPLILESIPESLMTNWSLIFPVVLIAALEVLFTIQTRGRKSLTIAITAAIPIALLRAGFKTCLQGFQAGRRRMVVFYNRLSTMTMQAA